MKKKYLWRHATGRWYVRVQGRYTRINAKPNTPEFDQEYWEILTGKRMQAKTSWKALISDYRKSGRWSRLKPRSREDYEKVFEYLEGKIGDRDVRSLTRQDVIKAQRANSHRVRFANYIQQVLRVLCEHAIDIGWLCGASRASSTRPADPPDKNR
ncbi:hypothetical protein [Phaeobacter inhibens]|uniref:hypothetical protein n=1 Tax=Phaeobacter inhibens TaxID=221822 RepID=UPI0021A48407|nr:hypothetical protein [Phaeobacter inhibens]